jgi:hypothetical protein
MIVNKINLHLRFAAGGRRITVSYLPLRGWLSHHFILGQAACKKLENALPCRDWVEGYSVAPVPNACHHAYCVWYAVQGSSHQHSGLKIKGRKYIFSLLLFSSRPPGLPIPIPIPNSQRVRLSFSSLDLGCRVRNEMEGFRVRESHHRSLLPPSCEL